MGMPSSDTTTKQKKWIEIKLASYRESYIMFSVMNNIPSKLVLTCTVSGKVVTWTNKTIIANKIKQFGSLEDFIKQFTCRGANKTNTTTITSIKSIKANKDIDTLVDIIRHCASVEMSKIHTRRMSNAHVIYGS